MITFKYQFTDIGYCRVCFTVEVQENTFYYCLQEDGSTVELFRCSDDEEPQSILTPKPGLTLKFDLPENPDEYVKELIERWAHKYPEVTINV